MNGRWNGRTDLVVMWLVAVWLVGGCAPVGGAGPVGPAQVAPLSGQVMEVQAGTVIKGVEAALAGRSGTVVLSNGRLMLFGWSMQDAWAFVAMDGGQALPVQHWRLTAGGKGALVNVKDFGELVKCLEAAGWEKLKNGAAPVAIQAAVLGVGSLIEVLVVPMPVLVMPEGLRDIDS